MPNSPVPPLKCASAPVPVPAIAVICSRSFTGLASPENPDVASGELPVSSFKVMVTGLAARPANSVFSIWLPNVSVLGVIKDEPRSSKLNSITV